MGRIVVTLPVRRKSSLCVTPGSKRRLSGAQAVRFEQPPSGSTRLASGAPVVADRDQRACCEQSKREAS